MHLAGNTVQRPGARTDPFMPDVFGSRSISRIELRGGGGGGGNCMSITGGLVDMEGEHNKGAVQQCHESTQSSANLNQYGQTVRNRKSAPPRLKI